jgi:hypothetical protein
MEKLDLALGHGLHLHDLAEIHDGDAMADLAYCFEIVGDEQT